jgi:hypothetical protein
MAAVSDKHRTVSLALLLFLVGSATCALNVPGVFWEPLPMSFRVGIPAFLIAGVAGAVMRNRILRFAGWIGIAWFALLVLYVAFLTDDYMFRTIPGGSPNVPSASAFLWRIAFILTNSALLIVLFRRITKNPRAISRD